MSEAERIRKRKDSRDFRNCPTVKPQTVKNESIEKFVAILVNQANYCVTSCVTKDMLCFFVGVMNFNFV